MKKLSLLMFTLLILGCGTETTVVEEPEPEEPPPVVMEGEPIGHPLIARGSVKHGEVNVDPESLGNMLYFEFTEHFLRFWALLREKDGYALAWDVLSDPGTTLVVQERRHDPLQHDTEYVLEIAALNYDCEIIEIDIQFGTKPQRPMVGRPAPMGQERIPVAPLGERFQLFDIAPAIIAAGTVADGDGNVDPEPLNENGIQFVFDEPIRKYKIDLRLHNGASLGWLPRGLVELENPGPQIKIMPAEGFPLLEFDTTYEINIFIQDFGCLDSNIRILFHTKPKP